MNEPSLAPAHPLLLDHARIRRGLAASNPAAFLPDLAVSLNNLSLPGLSRPPDEAATVREEAICIEQECRVKGWLRDRPSD